MTLNIQEYRDACLEELYRRKTIQQQPNIQQTPQQNRPLEICSTCDQAVHQNLNSYIHFQKLNEMGIESDLANISEYMMYLKTKLVTYKDEISKQDKLQEKLKQQNEFLQQQNNDENFNDSNYSSYEEQIEDLQKQLDQKKAERKETQSTEQQQAKYIQALQIRIMLSSKQLERLRDESEMQQEIINNKQQ